MYFILVLVGALAVLVGAVFGASAAATGQLKLSTVFLGVEILGGILMLWSLGKDVLPKE